MSARYRVVRPRDSSSNPCSAFILVVVVIVVAPVCLVALGISIAALTQSASETPLLVWEESQDLRRDDCGLGNVVLKECYDTNRNGICDPDEQVLFQQQFCNPERIAQQMLQLQHSNPIDEIQNAQIVKLDQRDVVLAGNATGARNDIVQIQQSLAIETALREYQYDLMADGLRNQGVRLGLVETLQAYVTGNLTETQNATVQIANLEVISSDHSQQLSDLQHRWDILNANYWQLSYNDSVVDQRLRYVEDAIKDSIQHAIDDMAIFSQLQENRTIVMEQLTRLIVANNTIWNVVFNERNRINQLQLTVNGLLQTNGAAGDSNALQLQIDSLFAEMSNARNYTENLLKQSFGRLIVLENGTVTQDGNIAALQGTSALLNSQVGILTFQVQQAQDRIALLEPIQLDQDLRLLYLERNLTQSRQLNLTLQTHEFQIQQLQANAVQYTGYDIQLTQLFQHQELEDTRYNNTLQLQSKLEELVLNQLHLENQLDVLFNLSLSADMQLNETVLAAVSEALVLKSTLEAYMNYTNTALLTHASEDAQVESLVLNLQSTQNAIENQVNIQTTQIQTLNSTMQTVQQHQNYLLGLADEWVTIRENGLQKTYQSMGVVCASGAADAQGNNLWEQGGHVTRTAVGRYSIAFVEPLAHANYPIFLNLCGDAQVSDVIQVVGGSKTTLGFAVQIRSGVAAFWDRMFSWGVTCQKNVLVDVKFT